VPEWKAKLPLATEKRTAVLIGASIAAAAAGIVAAAALWKFRNGDTTHESTAETDHRHLKQVLTDCYDKLQEIETRVIG
jgi:hypothetical protein